MQNVHCLVHTDKKRRNKTASRIVQYYRTMSVKEAEFFL